MAEVKYIKIPTNFFESEPITEIRTMSDGYSIVLLYLNLLCDTYRESRKGIFSICGIYLSDHEMFAHFRGRYDDIGDKLKVLEDYELIKRKRDSIQVFKFWEDKHDRNSERYKSWRSAVFNRDGYRCRECGGIANLQAHHIKHWKSNKDLRYDVDNGVTLCRKCHLKAHGGCWKNG